MNFSFKQQLSAEEYTDTLFQQLKKIGIETVIVEEDVDEEQSPRNSPIYSPYSQISNKCIQIQLNGTTEDNFMDFSHLETTYKFDGNKQLPQKPIISVIKSQNQSINKNIVPFFPESKRKLQEIKKQIIQFLHEQINIFTASTKLLHQLINKHYIQQKHKIQILQSHLHEQIKKNTALSTQNNQLKLKNQQLADKNTKKKNGKSSQQQTQQNSQNQENLSFKMKYLQVVQKFSEEINRIQGELIRFKNKQAQKHQEFQEWEEQIREKQNEIKKKQAFMETKQKVLLQFEKNLKYKESQLLRKLENIEYEKNILGNGDTNGRYLEVGSHKNSSTEKLGVWASQSCYSTSYEKVNNLNQIANDRIHQHRKKQMNYPYKTQKNYDVSPLYHNRYQIYEKNIPNFVQTQQNRRLSFNEKFSHGIQEDGSAKLEKNIRCTTDKDVIFTKETTKNPKNIMKNFFQLTHERPLQRFRKQKRFSTSYNTSNTSPATKNYHLNSSMNARNQLRKIQKRLHQDLSQVSAYCTQKYY